MIWLFTILFALSTSAHPLETPEAPAITDTFNLYAYGEGISGLPVFYADGKAEIGDPTLSTAEFAQPVYFTTSPTSIHTFLAHPNTTTTNVAQFTSLVFTLPATDSTDGRVQFTNPATESGFTALVNSASQFDVYGNYILIEAENANFYAIPSEEEGVWGLVWSDVEIQQGEVAVSLRTIAPATDTLLRGDTIERFRGDVY
ncbi:hypothetical protein BDV12DRAFT_208234 [Aspergillus spectabilis]